MTDNLLLPDSRPPRADAQKNRLALLEAAQRLFAEQGVEAVSMTAIAEAAGVGKGTLYRHFENKGELCHALLDEDQRDLQMRTLSRLSQPDDAENKLAWFVDEVISFVTRNEALLCAGPSESFSTLRHPAHTWWRQTMRGLLHQIDPPGDIDYLTDLFYIMLDVRNLQYQRQVRGYSREHIAHNLQDILSRLLR